MPAAPTVSGLTGMALIEARGNDPTIYYIRGMDTSWDDGTKTIYDPCPAGWRVPKNETWGDFTAAATASDWGLLYQPAGGTVEALYPAAGARVAYYSGGVYSIGEQGAYWSSGNRIFEFNGDYFHPNNEYSAYHGIDGFPVRCIQE